MTGARGASLDWDRQGRVTPAQRDAQNVSPPRRRKPGLVLSPLQMKDSLGREPRWNADSRAAPSCKGGGSGRTRKARQNTAFASVGVSPPNFFVRLRSETRGNHHPRFASSVSCLANSEWRVANRENPFVIRYSPSPIA